MEYQLETYQLQLVDNENATCNIRILPNTGKALLKERRKLYIISNDTEILYVGEANSSIKVRFQRASSAFNHFIIKEKARNGYKGYKWLNKKDNLERKLKVSAVIFNEVYDAEIKRSFIEAIEGELVYLIRNKFGYWPKFQNEIHFSNRIGALEIAEDILEQIL